MKFLVKVKNGKERVVYFLQQEEKKKNEGRKGAVDDVCSKRRMLNNICFSIPLLRLHC